MKVKHPNRVLLSTIVSITTVLLITKNQGKIAQVQTEEMINSVSWSYRRERSSNRVLEGVLIRYFKLLLKMVVKKFFNGWIN